MSKKKIISLTVSVALVAVTIWYLRKQAQSLLHLAVEDEDDAEPVAEIDELALLDEEAVQDFLRRHPVRDPGQPVAE